MPEIDVARLCTLIHGTIGPTPWYWSTFPRIQSSAGQRFVWSHHGSGGPLGYIVSLSLDHEPDRPRLALNTYCRPFIVPPHYLGIWCPGYRNLRFAIFDPDQLGVFDFAATAGWFKQSTERIYSATPPVAEFELPLDFNAGTHKIEVPKVMRTVEEIIVPTDYKKVHQDSPACALFVLYPHAGLLQVLPQNWFTGTQFDLGYQWITRAARDPETFRIMGDGIRIRIFLLQEDGCSLDRWIGTTT